GGHFRVIGKALKSAMESSFVSATLLRRIAQATGAYSLAASPFRLVKQALPRPVPIVNTPQCSTSCTDAALPQAATADYALGIFPTREAHEAPHDRGELLGRYQP